MRRFLTVFLAAILLISVMPSTAEAETRSAWPPMPGVALKAGGGWYHSVPCGCVDRGLFNIEVTARLHFGSWVAVEAETQRGIMLLGGRFPSSGWGAGLSAAVLPQHGRWWDGLNLRAGYRQWRVMGMREDGTAGFYTGLNWAIEVLPHLYIEAEGRTGRTFEVMPHWNYEGRLGVSTRF